MNTNNMIVSIFSVDRLELIFSINNEIDDVMPYDDTIRFILTKFESIYSI